MKKKKKMDQKGGTRPYQSPGSASVCVTFDAIVNFDTEANASVTCKRPIHMELQRLRQFLMQCIEINFAIILML